jgi:hypothetical protein
MAKTVKTSSLPTSKAGTSTAPMTVSGMIPTSGVVTDSSGPWMIEEQTLTIDYTRVPYYAASSVTHSLATPSRGYRVAATVLNVNVEATYSKQKSYDQFTTSSWTQPQTFIYDTQDNDNYNASYGDTGASALGPNGTINTLQKWYHRRAWVSSIDVEETQNCVGTRHYFAGFSGMNTFGGLVATPAEDGLANWGEFGRFAPKRDRAHTFMRGSQTQQKNSLYTLAGPYSTSLETGSRIQQTIDHIGTLIRQLNLYGIGPALTAGGTTSEGIFAQDDVGCSSYSSSRHEWN